VQTRTRVYMFAFDKANDDRVTEWKEMMKTFERPASASLEVAPCARLDHWRSDGLAGWRIPAALLPSAFRSPLSADLTRAHYSLGVQAFLLPSDDARIHRARLDLSRRDTDLGGRSNDTPWEKCESRHQAPPHSRASCVPSSRRGLRG
jgi:hypothetical protein